MNIPFRLHHHLVLFACLPPLLFAEPAPRPLDYYLPAKASNYDPSIPTPEQALGFQIGQWHLHHHELVDYLRLIAAKSDRVTVVEYARSHGRRPLIHLIVTATENHAHLEQIRRDHVARVTDPKDKSRLDGAPIVVWMGYSIHGNEPSGANSSALLAYHLAAARDPDTLSLLKNAVILIDPCLNPDGFERFADWSNNHRGRHPSAHRADREHGEGWPSGRPNYYWFDLNRDWLPAVHPESQGRLKQFHLWQPNIVTDFHEMGNVNRTYFFQPGFSKMIHPLTPKENQALTEKMAAEHARSLDAIGSLYYTGESYDDYYIGKGSTYPDLNGSVGVLFEQASSRGYHQDTEHGRLEFPFTIRNQLTTTLSTLRTAQRLRTEFLEFQRDFYRDALKEAADSKTKAFIFSAPGDPVRLTAFKDLLSLHQIESHAPASDVKTDGQVFAAAESLVVPVNQRQFRLITALFETRTNFQSAIFYDVSAWRLPSAFGLLGAELKSVPKAAAQTARSGGSVKGADKAYAYVLPWEPRHAPRALFRLLDAKARCWVATKPFTTKVGGLSRTWEPGSVLVPVGPQDGIEPAALRMLMDELARNNVLEIHALDTGYHGSMPDLGSPSFLPVTHKRVLMLVGSGTGSVTTGSLWHHFDEVLQTPLTMVEAAQLTTTVLDDHSTVLLADATFTSLPEPAKTALQGWVSRGGTLIAIGTTVKSLAAQSWCKVELTGSEAASASSTTNAPAASSKDKSTEEKPGSTTKARTAPKHLPYAEADERRAEKNLDGVIVRATYDATHPLAFGFDGRPFIELMRDGTTFLKPSSNAYLNPLLYAGDPLVSGYASKANIAQLRLTTPVQVRVVDSGRVIYMTDNPVFRGHWLGTEKLLANAIFFGPLVKSSGGGDEEAEAH